MGKNRTFLRTWPEKQLSKADFLRLEGLARRRMQGEPIAYILGRQPFWGLDFKVTPAVLIPRADTETLVEAVLEQYPSRNQKLQCLELGVGSGAIITSLSVERPHWQCVGVDLSADALQVAKCNIETHGCARRIQLLQSDWFNAISPNETFDIIISNPPYIEVGDPNLCQYVDQFEPKAALLAAEKGLADLKHIISCAASHLKNKGYLFLEHGFEQGEAVRRELLTHGFQHYQALYDLSGHWRGSQAQKGS